MGRCEYIKNILHISNVKMAFYVDSSYTLENVVLIASAGAEGKNWIKKSGSWNHTETSKVVAFEAASL